MFRSRRAVRPGSKNCIPGSAGGSVSVAEGLLHPTTGRRAIIQARGTPIARTLAARHTKPNTRSDSFRHTCSSETRHPPAPHSREPTSRPRPHSGCRIGSGNVTSNQAEAAARTPEPAAKSATSPRSLEGPTLDPMASQIRSSRMLMALGSSSVNPRMSSMSSRHKRRHGRGCFLG